LDLSFKHNFAPNTSFLSLSLAPRISHPWDGFESGSETGEENERILENI
jgi:hypothetical protein